MRHDDRQQFEMPFTEHFYKTLVQGTRWWLPTEDLLDNLLGLLKAVFQILHIRSGLQQGCDCQHAWLPLGSATYLLASKQCWHQQPIYDFLNRLMIDNNVRRSVLLRHPKLLFGDWWGLATALRMQFAGSLNKATNPCRIKTFCFPGSRRRVPMVTNQRVAKNGLTADWATCHFAQLGPDLPRGRAVE